MITLPGHPLLDDLRMIGGCARLPVRVDAEHCRRKCVGPAEMWLSRGGRVGVHNPAQAIFLRGHAPAESNLPIEDREALRHVLRPRVMTQRLRRRCAACARLPGGAVIAAHRPSRLFLQRFASTCRYDARLGMDVLRRAYAAAGRSLA
jgi:hypothetical protein